MPDVVRTTSIQLRGDLAERVTRRANGEPAARRIKRDLERYYRLVDLADTDLGGKALTLDQALVLVGERPLRRRVSGRARG
jgi:hypothetical protein